MNIFAGIQETILAGVDGYVTIEAAKAANSRTETVAPAPVAEYENQSQPQVIAGISNGVLWGGAAALVLVVLVAMK